jgi:DNA-binding NarL/FixJ family response regulator
MAVIRVSIVEDNPQLREQFARLVDETEGLQRVSDYGSAEDALARLAHDNPDVVLMDIQLPGMNGVECVRRLKTVAPNIQVVMLTVFEHSDWIFDSLKAGASGYVLKRATRQEIVEAIQQVHDGGAPMSCSVARKVVQFFSQRQAAIASVNQELSQLTEREHTVLAKLSEGLSYDEIANALAISINTVRKHIRAIYEKLQVGSRTEAAAKFLRQ